jgi:hypothetical protein
MSRTSRQSLAHCDGMPRWPSADVVNLRHHWSVLPRRRTHYPRHGPVANFRDRLARTVTSADIAMTYRSLVTDEVDPEGIELRRAAPEFHIDVVPPVQWATILHLQG